MMSGGEFFEGIFSREGMAWDGHNNAGFMFQEFESGQPSNWRVDHQTVGFHRQKKWGQGPSNVGI